MNHVKSGVIYFSVIYFSAFIYSRIRYYSYVEPGPNTNEEDNEDESDDSDGYIDGNDILIKKKKELVHFNADDQRLNFSLGMIFF